MSTAFADQELLQASFSLGVVRDRPRFSIPPGGLYDAADCLVDMPGLLRERGGSAYQGSDLGASQYPLDIMVIPFEADTRVATFSGTASSVHAYDITSTKVDAGSVVNPSRQSCFYFDKVVLPNTGKVLYLNTGVLTARDMNGDPPDANLAVAHAGRVVMGHGPSFYNRIWFSPIPDIESTWDVDNAYIDCSYAPTGLASLGGALLIFSRSSCERLLGDVPPGTTGENMALQPYASVGCADARSLAYWSGGVIVANELGVYYVDGASSPRSLTEKDDGTGIAASWRASMSGFAADTMRCAGGVFGNEFYVVTISVPGTPWTLTAGWICHLPTQRWTRLTNHAFTALAASITGTPKLYGANAAGTRCVELSDLFAATRANKNDANGTAVTALVETGVLASGVGLKAYGDAHLTYDLRDAASDNPTVAVAVAAGIEAPSYTAVAVSPLAETTNATRKRFMVSQDSQGVSVKFTRAAAASKFEMYALELFQRQYPLDSDGQ